MQWVSQLTEGLANLSVKMVLIAVGIMMVALSTFRISRNRTSDSIWMIENLQVVLSVVVVVFLVIRPFLFQAFYIPSSSMEPTLMGPQQTGGKRETTGDRLLVNKLIYRVSNPHRGDIVVFHAPPEASPLERDHPEGKEFIKRVVGLPKEVVEVVGPQILLDGRPALSVLDGSVFSPPDAQHPEKCVSGNTASLVDFNQKTFKVIAYPTPSVRFDPSRVEVNGKVELEDPQGRIREGTGLSGYGADFGVQATVYSVENQPRLAVVTGTTLSYQSGHVVVNGKRLNEGRYIKEPPRYVMAPKTLGPNEYFMMGDNRNNSNDSHVWGALDRSRVIGRAELLFWPLNRFAVIQWWLLSLMGGFFIGYNGLQRLVSSR